MKRLSQHFLISETGQSIVLIALLLSFVFLAFAALAIDGTIIYRHRRELQNSADAAALSAAIALAQGSSDTAAYQEAMGNIAANSGLVEWYSFDGSPAPAGNVGSGQNLTMGIEITNSCDVRVALEWRDIGTYFAQFIGHKMLEVGAKARAGCNRSGGLQPIAVKRFGDERDWNLSLNNVNTATVYCDTCSIQRSLSGTLTTAPQGLGNATDFLRPNGSDTILEWPGWPGGQALYQSPSPHADLAAGAPGRDYFILGQGVGPNIGTTSYGGLVNLDIRHIASPPLEYYNSVTAGTNSNVLKDLAEYYIRRGYCCDIPTPGDQIAMFNGNSTAFAAQAFRETYAVGDTVAVIVYDGHVFNTPNLSLTGPSPNYKTTYPTTTTVTSPANVLSYTLTLKAEQGFQSAAGGLTMSVEGLDGFADWRFGPTASPVVGRNGINQLNITLYVTPTVTTIGASTAVVTGTRMFYVKAWDNQSGGSGIRRYWAGIASIGDTVNSVQQKQPAVTGTPTNSDQTYPFLSVVKGQQAKYSVELDLWGGAANQSVTVNPVGSLPTGFSWVSSPPWSKNTNSNHPGSSFNLNIKIDQNTAVAQSTPYVLPFIVSAGTMTQTFNLYVLVEEANTTVNDYVEILGYATLQVTGYYNSSNLIDPSSSSPANAVRGRIVSPLFGTPSDLISGLRARLIPWDTP